MSAGAGQHDSRNHGWYFLLAIFITVTPWFIAVPFAYTIPKNRQFAGYYYSMLATPQNPLLIFSLVVGLVLAGLLVYFLVTFNKTNFKGAKFQEKLRGTEMVSHMKLCQANKEKGVEQLSFCETPIPTKSENLHYILIGSTGSGKTQAILDFLDSVFMRNTDRVLCVDPNGGFMRHYYQAGDVILNPFDERGEGWSILNEIRTLFDCENYAKTMIPKSPSTEQESWNSMARVLVSETLIALHKNEAPILIEHKKLFDKMSKTERLFYFLITAPKDMLYKLLMGTPAQGLFDAEETFSSIKAVLTQYIKPHKYLKAGTFSIRDYLENPTGGNLWIPWKEDQLEALKPLIACWMDVICASVLSMPDLDTKRKGFVGVFDELDSLEKLNNLLQALTKGRKHGFKIVGAVQSLAQLDETYGKNDALTLRNSFSSVACCHVSSLDTYTADQAHRAFGDHDVTRYQDSMSVGTGGGKGSRQLVKETEYLVKASELNGLSPNQFYFRIAQSNMVCLHKIKPKNRPLVTEGFKLIDNEWTKQKDMEGVL
jgi:type IV secretory pathway TraG/TraD family ATPase VirD4